MRPWLLARIAGLVLAAALAGCGGRDWPEPRACVPVTGKLLVRSQPAAGATVYFHPQDGSQTEEWGSGFPRAVVGADGGFQVSTYQEHDGAPPGEYRLLVEWLPRSSTAEGGEDEAEASEAAIDRLNGQYMNPETTTLRATVGDAATELPTINLP